MEFSYQGPVAAAGPIITYPEYVFGNQPLAPSAVKETIQLAGSAGNTIAITGTIDDWQGGS